MYFMEEVGELAEALREPEQHDLDGEFADCLAWLTSLAHLAGVVGGSHQHQIHPIALVVTPVHAAVTANPNPLSAAALPLTALLASHSVLCVVIGALFLGHLRCNS